MRFSMTCLFAIVSVAWTCHAESPSEHQPLKQAATIALKGVEGRIDHMAIDGQRQRLYIAALGNNTLEIIDLKERKPIGRIDGIKKPQGIAVIPDSGEIIV